MTKWQKDIIKHTLGLITETRCVYVDGLRMQRIAMNDDVLLLVNYNMRKNTIPLDKIVNVQIECTNSCIKLTVIDNLYASHDITICT